MTAPFDIFKKEPDGSVLWLGSAKSLDEAQLRARKLASTSLRDHIILNQTTGKKLTVNPNEAEAAARPDGGPEAEWKQRCLEAVTEADAAKVPEKAAAARKAIAQRLQELAQSQEGEAETIALQDAARAIEAVATVKQPQAEERPPQPPQTTSAGA